MQLIVVKKQATLACLFNIKGTYLKTLDTIRELKLPSKISLHKQDMLYFSPASGVTGISKVTTFLCLWLKCKCNELHQWFISEMG